MANLPHWRNTRVHINSWGEKSIINSTPKKKLSITKVSVWFLVLKKWEELGDGASTFSLGRHSDITCLVKGHAKL